MGEADVELADAARRRFHSPAGSPEMAAKVAARLATLAARKAQGLGNAQATAHAANTAERRAAKADAFEAALVPTDASRQWTPEKQMLFINTLGETGRVDMAVRAAGMKFSSLYALRRRDVAFAAAWADALAAHGELAEAIVLDAAINGYDPQAGVPKAERRVMSERLMVEVLRTRRARAVALTPPAEADHGAGLKAGEAARLTIEARLSEIARRLREAAQ